MTEEQFLTGFCRQIDGTRRITLEYEEKTGEIEAVDCGYETCVHRAACEIGKSITAILESCSP